MKRTRSIALLALTLTLGLAGPAFAQITAAPKPAYVNTSAATDFTFNFTPPTSATFGYKLCASRWDNTTPVDAASCSENLGSQPGSRTYASSGSADGHTYTVCVDGYRVGWEAIDATACASTTIDRNKPTVSVTLAGGKIYTKSTSVAVAIGYSDATSPRSANWTCTVSGALACAPAADCAGTGCTTT